MNIGWHLWDHLGEDFIPNLRHGMHFYDLTRSSHGNGCDEGNCGSTLFRHIHADGVDFEGIGEKSVIVTRAWIVVLFMAVLSAEVG